MDKAITALTAGDLDGADAALRSRGDNEETRLDRASLCVIRGDYAGALSLLGDNQTPRALYLRTFAQIAAADFDGAWASFCALRVKAPHHPELLTLRRMGVEVANKYGRTFGDWGRQEEIAFMLANANDHSFDAAAKRCQAGDLEEGHRLLREWAHGEFSSVSAGLRRVPVWDGRKVKRLLIMSIAGLGDAIQFSRFIREARQRADHITLAVPQQLIRLLSDVGADEVIADAGRYASIMKADAFTTADWTLWATLDARHYGQTPYLKASPALDPAKGLRVGLCWNASPQGAAARAAHLEDFEPLRSLKGIEFHSLVPNQAAAWMQVHRPADFQDTADVIESMDLVISTDTSVCHVAGGLNKPTWILVPTFGDWRWQTHETDTAWYPSARLCRRERGETWRDLVERVARLLDVKRAALRDRRGP